MRALWLAVRSTLAALLLPGVVGVVVPRWIAGGSIFASRDAWVDDVALFLMYAGAGLLATCIAYFAFVGRGTLAPVDPPTVFVARGPYRVSRNPMYVAVTLWLAGVALLVHSWPLALYAGFVAAAFHQFVTRVEEPQLRRRFGASWEAYCSRVPRWPWPVRGTRGAR